MIPVWADRNRTADEWWPQHLSCEVNTPDRENVTADHNDCSACLFLPEVHMSTQPGRGHDFEVSLYRFIAPLWPHFLPYCIPWEPFIWAFIKQVHRHGGGAAALVSQGPSASSKSSIYLCYEGHVERAVGVALRDNCLTILRDLW